MLLSVCCRTSHRADGQSVNDSPQAAAAHDNTMPVESVFILLIVDPPVARAFR